MTSHTHQISRGRPRPNYRAEVSLMDGLIKVDEVASMLQVSRWTVYRLIKEREIVSVKVGSSRRVPVQAVRDYIASLIEAA